MKKADYLKRSFLNAAGVFIYISFVVTLISNAQTLFGKGEDNMFAPIFMLLLFIISASITGFLVLGKPAELYLSGAKKEAMVLFFSTLIWLGVFLFTVAILLVQ